MHDAARPGLPFDALERLIDIGFGHPVGAILAMPVADTLKRQKQSPAVVNHEKAPVIESTISRDSLWGAQTPQMFRLKPLHDALVSAEKKGLAVTDEASAMELAGLQPALVAGDLQNWKITYAEDLTRVGLLMGQGNTRLTANSIRVGQGYDVHALVKGRKLVLGGVDIAHDKGLLGHSDADALLHAITDALLGAAGLGDIGTHFPDTDAAFKGADSAVLLAQALKAVVEAGWRVGNLDCTVIAQKPKLANYIPAMRERIAGLLSVPADCVNIKAKTNEKLGYLGREEAIEAQASVLLFGAGS